MQVKKKDDGQIYAMKVLRKEAIIARKQVDHTRAEKAILQKIEHPFIVKLNYAFQTEEKLYMVLDFVNDPEDVLEAFKVYYGANYMEEEHQTDPNNLFFESRDF